jgi:2-iminobutanoate/2-iminopropanoate deaminase
MPRQAISTDQAPAAIGPYSQAVATDSLVFISGQLPIDPATGKMVTGTIAEQTRQILKNAAAIAKEAGSGLEQAVKTTIFLTDLGNFQEVNSAYAEHFPVPPPARSTIQVAGLPLGSPIEIELILAR